MNSGCEYIFYPRNKKQVGVLHMKTDHVIKKSLNIIIANRLKEDIWNRQILLGERLIESELAKRFDVGRSTIREALIMLEQKGLIISKARRGTYVTQFSKQDIKEIIDLRILIETNAFINSLPSLKDHQFHDLESILKEIEHSVEKKDWTILFDLDMKFHSYVVNLCGNSRMIKIYNSTQAQTRAYLGYIDQYYSSHQAFYREHLDLFKVLKQKNINLLKKQLKCHIKYAETTLIYAHS